MKQYYGDETRWFIARVISIDDPLELGRVRIRIFGIHSDRTEDIPHADLPWAQTIVPVTEGGSSGIGTTVGIKEQSQVFGVFLDGKNSQLPLVIGSIPKFEADAGAQGYARTETDSPTIDLKGATNTEQAYNWFLSKEGGDFTPAQSAGIVGNLLKESQTGGDLNPLALNTAEGSFGIAQWNPAKAAGYRKRNLIEYSKENGFDYRTMEAQLSFITHELFTTEKTALKKVRAAKTAREAALAFEWFERPAGWTTTTPSLTAEDRVAFAEATLDNMETA